MLMPVEESHNADHETQSLSIPVHTHEWLQEFLKHFEINFIDLHATSGSGENPNLPLTALRTLVTTLQDAGLSTEEVFELFGQVEVGRRSKPAAWTSDLNARRFELIDKDIQGTLTPIERIELARLTTMMRQQVDSELNLPLEGAKSLHLKLLAKIVPDHQP